MDDTGFESWARTLEIDGFVHIAAWQKADPLAFLGYLGELQPQYDGKLLWSIKADPKFDDHYHSLNTKTLSPHTECYEFPGLPPRYLALWCKRAPTCGGGQTTLYDSRLFLRTRDQDELTCLRQRAFRYFSSSGIQASSLARSARHTMLEDVGGREIFRFSRNCVDFEDCELAARFAEELVAAFEKERVEIDWQEGAILVWDNQRTLHSRTSFVDRERELIRAWVS